MNKFCELAETYQSLAAWVTASAAALAVLVAILTIYMSRKTAQRRASIDYLITTERDKQWDEGLKLIRIARDAGKNNTLAALAADGDPADENSEERAKKFGAITDALNLLEYMAVGIRENVFCEKTLKRSVYSIVVRTYEGTEDFIKQMRVKNKCSTNFQELEWLAKRWEKTPLRKSK